MIKLQSAVSASKSLGLDWPFTTAGHVVKESVRSAPLANGVYHCGVGTTQSECAILVKRGQTGFKIVSADFLFTSIQIVKLVSQLFDSLHVGF